MRARAARLIPRIRAQRLTYLSEAKLWALAEACIRAETGALPGRFIEAGCALGGSAVLMAGLKDVRRELHVYDVFGMIPPPSDRDGEDVVSRYQAIAGGKAKGIGGDRYYGYLDDLYERVAASLESFGLPPAQNNISLVKGMVQDTLHVDAPVSLAHIDVDWYEPVITCLQRITPYLCDGGTIILDDYHDWSGCLRATDDYFRTRKEGFLFDDSHGSMVVTRH
jgi:asparagine synthase (glutamine-hydrolysing)